MKNKTLIGIRVVAIILIVTSLFQFFVILKAGFLFDRYKYIFSYYPENTLWLRYGFSWLQRIIGLAAGIGIFYQKELYRKIAIFFLTFMLATLYWKHPYQGFTNMAHYIGVCQNDMLVQFTHITCKTIILPAVIVNCLLDLIFAGSIIFYLTRPKVKIHFK